MISQKRQILVLGVLTVFISAGLLFPGLLFSGDLDPTNPPGSTMHNLEDIYNKASDTNARLDATAFVEKTGQTTSYATGDDGDLMKGVAWPDPRFTNNGDGTVTDKHTGLIWLKNINCLGIRLWSDALTDCSSLANGSCGLTDGSSAGDWRMPNIKELQSLVDYGHVLPALPPGHPFTVGSIDHYFWSSTSNAYEPPSNYAWVMDLGNGYSRNYNKGSDGFVWPVRGGN